MSVKNLNDALSQTFKLNFKKHCTNVNRQKIRIWNRHRLFSLLKYGTFIKKQAFLPETKTFRTQHFESPHFIFF